MAIPSILEQILDVKHQEIESSQTTMPQVILEHLIADQEEMPRGFYQQLKQKADLKQNAVIAEIKKASPSKGIICEQFDSAFIAKDYQKNGATCLSVLTDEQFFQGSEVYLEEARLSTSLPIIRKDFIVSEYQIYQSKAMGADCILLIAACLNTSQLRDYAQLAYELEMDVLVEVHHLEELNKVQNIPLRMIGINNRNLHTFEVDLNTTFELMAAIDPKVLIVTESGISSKEEVELMNDRGVFTFLVGESFMRKPSPGNELKQLFG